MRIFFGSLVALLLALNSLGQLATQVVRGVVIDEASNAPIAYAHVVIVGTDPLLGAATDSAGQFSIASVPLGRYSVRFSCTGYKTSTLPEVEVSAAREVVLNATLRDADNTLQEVTIKHQVNKAKALNNMATVSARMLSVEESKRYAGAFDDPSRLVTSFAGVAGNIGNNGIVVRGNAPQYLQWKMEGVEIPNPNHFADLTVFGGGGLTALSSNLLANSDFFTGAFPAEYSNALSGVFDIFMRNGNSQKHEHTFQLGLIGIDAASEGPIGKRGGASYLFNYRYSTLTLMEPFLPENARGVRYQDLSFKFNFPTKKAGTFTLWGIGLADRSGTQHQPDSTQWQYSSDKDDVTARQYMGAAGMSHKYFFNNNTYLKTIVAKSISGLALDVDILAANRKMVPQSSIGSLSQDYTLVSFLNKKWSSRHTNRTGINVRGLGYSLALNKAFATGAPLSSIIDARGITALITAYSNSTIDLTPQLKANVGLNTQYFALNGRKTIEPRAGIRWTASNRHAYAVAYGLHSRLERLNLYLNNSLTTNEQQVNKNLDFSKAHHFVASYDWAISEVMRFKAEAYFLWLFHIPVTEQGAFSVLNMQNDWFFADKLYNKGTGRNYGLDLTLERYMSRGYYFLTTGSLFSSEYRGADAVWRNTRYNRTFLLNCLGGKEWHLGKEAKNTLGLNLRFALQGGDRYTLPDSLLSVQAQTPVFTDSKQFSAQLAPTLGVHFTANYKWNKKHTTHEVALKVLNITAQREFRGYRYNLVTGTIDRQDELIFIPNLSYRIEF